MWAILATFTARGGVFRDFRVSDHDPAAFRAREKRRHFPEAVLCPSGAAHFPGSYVFVACVALLWAAGVVQLHRGMTVVNVGLAVLIHRSVYCREDRVGRLLNWKPLAFIGVLSYSLYLWQQLFLDRHTDAWRTAFPQNLLLTTVAAMLSYLLLEKPLMKLRHRLHR
jgi:peptidoglycan/LPS O-acetylase OafA/YrhL